MKFAKKLNVPGLLSELPLELAPSPSGKKVEDALDEALEESFPASDPVAIKVERALCTDTPCR